VGRAIETAGLPHIHLSVPGQTKPVIVSTGAEIEKWLIGDPDTADARAKARAERAAKHRVWKEFDQRLGYSKARAAEGEAQDDEEVLLETLRETPARMTIGIAGKLHAMLKTGEPREGSPGFPWPRSACCSSAYCASTARRHRTARCMRKVAARRLAASGLSFAIAYKRTAISLG
jgi:hypothetical protein